MLEVLPVNKPPRFKRNWEKTLEVFDEMLEILLVNKPPRFKRN